MARQAADMSTVSLSQTLVQGIGAQVTAADPSGSVWVSANAGTGKTRVLVDRISRLLLAGTPAHRILCLTFTKAAAAEMANRLNDRLGHWAAADADALRDSLHALFGRAPSDDEERRARRLFAETIDAPEGLRIRTIHSFCESLLGRFPLESGLPAHFTVIDERRAAELREAARDRVFNRAATMQDSTLNEALNHLAGLVDETGFADVMAELDAGRHKLHAMIAAHGGLGPLIEAGRRRLGLEDDDTRASTIAAACADAAFDGPGLADAVSALKEGTKTDLDRAAQINHWLSHDPNDRAAEFISDYASVFLTQKNEPRALKGLMTKKPAEAHPQALDAMLAEQTRVFDVIQRLKAIAIADNTHALLSVGAALLETYEALKRLRAQVDYDDLIEKAQALLDTPGRISWVHFKLDGGIDHVLVDEAQDTSPVQWRVIEALAGDFFSGAGRELERPRTLFAVGDEKQSIYSFQGADPAEFGVTGARAGERARAAAQTWNKVEMALSWRSAPAILRAVDAVFARDIAADGLTWDERPVRHQWSRDGEAGLVELWPTERPLIVGDDDPWDAPLDQISAESPDVRLAGKIADTIAGWIAGGEELISQGRPIEPGDVMVLVRTRGVFAEEVVRALKDHDIPVAGRDRIILTDHLAVMDLIAAARFALLPDDDLNTATVLKGPFIEMNEDVLFELAHDRTTRLWAELVRRKDEPAFTKAHARLAQFLSRADTMPPYEFFTAILADGGRESLLAHLGAEAADPVDEFMALTLDFERDHVPSLESFVHWVEHGETEVKRDLEQSGGEVRVMTTHGAKGLQARIVFLADTCSLPARQLADRVRWGDKEPDPRDRFVLWPAFKDFEESVTAGIAEASRIATEQEYRRLLYVAMTRAEDRLYICGWKGERELDDGCWYRLAEEGLKSLDATETLAFGEMDILRLTSPQTVPAKQAEMTLALAGGALTLPDWATRPPAPEPAPTQPLSPSKPETEPAVRSPLQPDDTNRFLRGKLIHALLQTLPDLPTRARADAARRYLEMPGHGLDGGEVQAIALETLGILEDAAFAPLFGSGSRAEVPMVGTLPAGDGGEGVVVSGQVDRLLVTDDEVIVIDYKTNRPPPLSEADVPGVYLRQMAVYRALLGAIYPDRTIRAALLWTDGPRLMPLDPDRLDGYLDDASLRA
ncbi:MAG: double-strand break repair helicase AddA [Rhodospirillaceae bacterium]|nr:double-strand break repair helicase AddA [Rhodospirillaceae bacterium]